MTEKRRRLDPASRRQEIFDAAVAELTARGMAVRVEDIVARAGAAKGTFYTCFATWDDLLEAIRSDLIATYFARHGHLLSVDSPAQWSRRLPELSEHFVAFLIEMGGLHDVLFHSAFTLNRPLPAERKPTTHIAALLEAGQKAGVYASMDSQMVANLIFALIHETADAIMADGAQGQEGERERRLDALKHTLNRITLKEMPK